MGAVIVASVVTRAGVRPLDAVPSLVGTVAGLIVLRLLVSRLRGCRPFRMLRPMLRPKHLSARPPPGGPSSRPTGITAAAAGIAATGGRLLSAARSNVAQARESLRLPAPAMARSRCAGRGAVGCPA
jgi:hypothetical protein